MNLFMKPINVSGSECMHLVDGSGCRVDNVSESKVKSV
jgi:hypothetical protein